MQRNLIAAALPAGFVKVTVLGDEVKILRQETVLLKKTNRGCRKMNIMHFAAPSIITSRMSIPVFVFENYFTVVNLDTPFTLRRDNHTILASI